MLVDREASERQACHGKILMLFFVKNPPAFFSRGSAPAWPDKTEKPTAGRASKNSGLFVFFFRNEQKERTVRATGQGGSDREI